MTISLANRKSQIANTTGFTLVEVLATFVLIGIVVPVAMRGVSLATEAASRARHLSEASTMAETKLNQILAETAIANPAQSGDFGPDHPGYQWTFQSTPGDYSLSQATLVVTWTERGQPRTYSLSTLYFDTSGASQ